MAALTFAVPVYDQTPAQLRGALASVLRQDGADWEAVVLDDGPGGAAYRDVVEALADERVRYVKNPQSRGIGAAWNACVDAVRTDFYTILHADDELLPNYASTMLAFARAHPDGALYFCGAEIIDDGGRRMFNMADFVKDFIRPPGGEVCIAGEAGLTRLGVGNFIMCPTVMYRRERTAARRFSLDLRFVLDLDFMTGLLLDGERFYGTAAVAYRYRRHAGAATHQMARTGYRFDEEIAFYRGLAERLRAAGMPRARRAARLMPFVRLNIAYSALSDVSRGRWTGARAKLRRLAGRRP